MAAATGFNTTSSRTGPPRGYHRLVPQSSVRGGFFLALVITVLWSGATAAAIYAAVYKESGNSTGMNWLMVIFTLVDLIFIFWLVKSFLRWVMTGQTTVDVNSPVAMPGEQLDVIVSQPGQFIIDKCTVDLVCQETATYTAGTDTVTKKEIVREMPICDLANLKARNGMMLTRQTINIPADAMLTFKSKNNQIDWLIRVKMIIPKRPDSEQLFSVRVATREIIAMEEGQANA